MYFQNLIAGGALLLASAGAQAQTTAVQDTIRTASSGVYTYVQQMPVFAGGQQGLLNAIGQGLTYPPEALQQRLQGNVIVSFVVSAQGKVQDITVSRSIHPLLDAAAVRAVQALPTFASPGKQAGRPVPVSLTVPIRFVLPANLPTATDTTHLQTAYSVATHGAHYAGGPEALRQYLSNVPLPPGVAASPTQPERVFVSFDINANGAIINPQAIQPLPVEERRRLHQPKPTSFPNPALVEVAVAHIRAMPVWQPARKLGEAVVAHLTLPVTFGPSNSALAYADEMPVFPNAGGEGLHTGRQIRYPTAALRSQTEGAVLLYYEVAEDGRLEKLEVIRSVSREIDAEALRVFRTNFPSYQPGRHQGQPARVFYLAPVTFRII